MIRVLHLTTDSKIAGAEKLLIGIAREFDRSKFEIFFCTLKKRGELHLELERLGNKVFSLNCSSLVDFPKAFFLLLYILRKHKIDILHTHLYHACFLGQMVACFRKESLGIITRHYSDLLYLYGNWIQRLLDRYSSRLAVHIIAISSGVKKVLVENDKINPGKVTVIYNGIDFSEFEKAKDLYRVRWEFGIDKDSRIIGSIGSLHPRKGHRFLIEAADILCRKYPDIKFMICGEGVLKKNLVELRDSFGLEDKVIFTGFRKDISDVINAFDIVIQPSLEEGFGLSIIEAMILGKPVIATRVGGIPEIIKNSSTGVLVQSKNPIALAQEIEYFLNNPEDRQKIGAEARKEVYSRFSLLTMIRKYESLYEDNIKKQ